MNNKERNFFQLGHIRDCINKIEYLSGKLHDCDNFEKQWVEQDAIIRNLEIIGKTAVNISDDLKARYPDVAWKEMQKMRNFVRYQYFGIELSDIWNTAVNDMPVLKKQIGNIINNFEEN